ncbi:Protein of unknown function DUF778 [Macleaya cordata]|uniref:Protein RTE1-HOMOLOG n=1 Tax=Macleaya cordata TaxID=56857 RepID=A0A200QDZ8_MACCD|nr:Protein of unknown function DUF778 [Macleaya cordata]
METHADADRALMLGETMPRIMQIDPKRSRFPCCIVWCPLPILSWLVPFIGHIGIGREDGVILDFAGPNFVCVDNFAFGAVSRYIQISKEKCCISPSVAEHESQIGYDQSEHRREIMTWDDAIRKSTQEFQHRSYNLFTCNCHSFVAHNLNRLGYGGGLCRWNVVNLAVLIFLKGQWVSKAAIVRSFLPFVIVFSLGLMLGGWSFLTALASFTLIIVGWFLLGTYFFKSLIQL